MITRTPVRLAPTFVIVTRTVERAGAPICSLECLGKWQIRQKQPILLGIGSKMNRNCSHCAVCATAIRIPEDCALHGIHCPASSWAGTISALETTAQLAGLRPGPISDSEFNAMLSLLQTFPEATPEDIARDIFNQSNDS